MRYTSYVIITDFIFCCKRVLAVLLKCKKSLHFLEVLHKKHGEQSSPCRTHFGRTHPNMTCTKWQVGCRSGPSLLPTSAPCQSIGGRSAIRPGSQTSLDINVGPNGRHYVPSRIYVFLFLVFICVELFHNQTVHSFQLCFVFNGAEDGIILILLHRFQNAYL